MRKLRQVFNRKLQRLILSMLLLILTTQLFAAPANATGIYQMPTQSDISHTWVIDKAEVLSRLSEGMLNKKLDNLAKQTGKELRLVTVRRLDYGETPTTFAKALFERWFPTPETQANQTLLVIDTLSNGIAIRTGEQAKSLLSDEIAESVTSETMLAPLRDGEKYNQAFLDASDRLVAVLSGDPDPGPPQVAAVQVEGTFKKADETKTSNATVWVIGLLLAATIIPMATYYLYQVIQS